MRVLQNWALLAAAMVIASTGFVEAGQKPIKAPSVTVKRGTTASIHDRYAWDEKCRAVAVRFRPIEARNGKLYSASGSYRIKGKPGDVCNGRKVAGVQIMFRPNSGFQGKALVRYSVTAPKMPDTYIVSRTIAVR
jgi:hypothetical protein